MSGSYASLRGVLGKVGYTPELVEDGYADEAGVPVAWCVGYARPPRIARNACVAAIDTCAPKTVGDVLSKTGAPVLLGIDHDLVTVWQGGAAGARKLEALPLQAFTDLTERARRLIDPRSIHRAKTLGRFDGSYQLEFVDIGLLPSIEYAQGADLQRLLERIVSELRRPDESLTKEQSHQVLTIAFWILAARMLRDHQVPGFVNLPAQGQTVLSSVARHYGGAVPVLAANPKWRTRVDAAAALAWKFGADLRQIGPEAIGYVYESSLIAAATRKDLGTHSTPPFIVEYVLGRLRDAILSIPVERRVVVEPACGHAAFLVAALRVLAEDVPADAARHDYLRARLRGLEIDHAAKEMARLSLTIADVPNPDGWDLREGDMFEGTALSELAQGGTILLANPPFEDFGAAERERIAGATGAAILSNKAAEMLRRVLPVLEPDAVIGVVVPRQFLHSDGDRRLRRALLEAFQLLEICVFPDHVFQFSDHECAIILARGMTGGTARNTPVTFRRVREAGMAGFRERAKVSAEEVVPGALFVDSPEANLLLPELRRLWAARNWSTLNDIAVVQQGLAYHGWVRESGHETIRSEWFEGSVRGVAGSEEASGALIMADPPYNYMDATKKHIRRTLGGLPTGKPQIVLNAHPHARGPWRLMAFIDPLGAAVPTSRIAVRPRSPAVTVEVLWALCNSLVANAFVYAHLGKRNITTGVFAKLPVPVLSATSCEGLARTVRDLFAACQKKASDEGLLRKLLRRIDVVVLGAYGLFASAEERLLSLFEGHARPGLPFKMTSVGTTSRLPQYLEVPDVLLELPPVSSSRSFALQADIDAEIDDGRRELAALRRAIRGTDSRVSARMAYVREMLKSLEAHAAEKWAPDYRPLP